MSFLNIFIKVIITCDQTMDEKYFEHFELGNASSDASSTDDEFTALTQNFTD